MKFAYPINVSFNSAIRNAAAQCGDGKTFSRKSPLTSEVLIRLLIGAEGGSLDKIAHAAGLEVTASAISQRRAQIDPAVFRSVFDSFNADCVDDLLFRDYRLLAVDGTTVNLPRHPAALSFVFHDGIQGRQPTPSDALVRPPGAHLYGRGDTTGAEEGRNRCACHDAGARVLSTQDAHHRRPRF